MEEQLCDLTSLETVCGGDANFMNQMIGLLKVNLPQELTEMSAALENKDFDAVRKLAHKMKPSVAYMCVDSMSVDVKCIESWSKNEDEMILNTKLFMKKLDKAVSELKEVG
ncbi:MAG: Hpt domain-containing protein [Vicingaceae bacterium]